MTFLVPFTLRYRSRLTIDTIRNDQIDVSQQHQILGPLFEASLLTFSEFFES